MEPADVMKQFTEFFDKNCTDKIISAEAFLEVQFDSLSQWSLDLANELLENPEDTIKAAEIALEEMVITGGRKLSVWFLNLPKTQQKNIWEVRKEDIGKMIALKGIINKFSPVLHICKSAKFECNSCGNVVNIIQMDDKFKEPTKCACGARGRFRMLDKEIANVIKLGLIDDLMDKENADRSLAREKLSILSGNDLTSFEIDKKIKPGKKVILNGYFKYVQKEGSTEFVSIFQVNSIEFVQVGWDTVIVGEKEAEQIKELAKEKDIISRLAESVSDVEGYPEVKQACLLQLAGAPNLYDKNGHLTSRGTIHLLLIGNPGGAKTYHAKRAGSVSPIHYFQSAANASGKGMVASVVKDPDTDGYAIYPGVVAMANHGISIIDEIDKTNKDDYGDHNNAMNDMVAIIAKANIKAKLETETCYLATANPKHRIFTSFEPYHEQIDMPKDFQDRFDDILLMMPSGKPEQRDRVMEIILDRTIAEQKETWNPEFSHEFIQKYIAYCRRTNPRPKMSRELFGTIKKRMTELMRPKDESQTKVSYRHLESIMRFTFASARLRLRDITEEDIDLAFVLKFTSFKDLGIIDTSGIYNWAVEEGVHEEDISDDKKMHDALLSLLPDKEKLVDMQSFIDACKAKGVAEEKVEAYIDKKKMIGDLMEPRRGFLKRM